MIPRSVQPKAGAEAYKTYEVLQPTDTHTRPATCAEVQCPRQANGWRVRLDVSTVKDRADAVWIRDRSGRSFTHTQVGPIVTFTFPAGQRCFGAHRVSLHREPLFRVRGGDFRGNPRGLPTLMLGAQDWIDNFGEHQARLKDAQQKG